MGVYITHLISVHMFKGNEFAHVKNDENVNVYLRTVTQLSIIMNSN